MNPLVKALRQRMPEVYSDELTDNEVLQRAIEMAELNVTPRELANRTGTRSTDGGRMARRLAQGFGNQAAFGFGPELAEFSAPLLQNVMGAAEYAGTALTGGDLKKAANRWNAVIEGGFRDLGIFADTELDKARQDAPISMGAAELGGGIAGAALPLKAPGAVLGKAASGTARMRGAAAPVANRVGQMARSRVNRAMLPTTLPKQAAMGAGLGAASGAGNAEEGQRAEGALFGGMLGAALPVAGRGAGMAAGAAARFSPTGALMRAGGGMLDGIVEGTRRGYTPRGMAAYVARRTAGAAAAPYIDAFRRGTGTAGATAAKAAPTTVARPPPPRLPATAAPPAAPPTAPSAMVPPTRPARPGTVSPTRMSPTFVRNGTIDLPEPLPDEILPVPEPVIEPPLFGGFGSPTPAVGPPMSPGGKVRPAGLLGNRPPTTSIKTVTDAIAKAPTAHGFTDRVSVAEAFDIYKAQNPKATLASFKKDLIERHKRREITLARLDNTKLWSDKLRDRSEITVDGRRFHTIRR